MDEIKTKKNVGDRAKSMKETDTQIQAEEAQCEPESWMRNIIESIPVGLHMYHLEPDGRLIFIGANAAADRILGVDNKQFIGKTIEESFPPLKDTEVPGRYRDVAHSGKAWRTENIEYQHNVIKGAFEVHAFQTAPDTMVAAFEDITARKKSELALKQSEEKYRRLYNDTPILLHSIDRNGIVVDVNDYWLKIMGYKRNEVIGRKVTDFYTDASRKNAVEVIQPAFFRDGSVKDVSYQFIKKNGDVLDVLLSASAERDSSGNVVRSLGVIEDITERKRMEEAFRESKERLDLALRSARMGVWHWEIKENKRYFDDLTCQLLGIESATFTGTAEEFFQRVHPEDREKLKAALARTIEQDVLYEPKYRIVLPDGSVYYITARGRLVRDDKGQPARISGILWDITEQHLLDQERIKTQKLESIGTLAGGIAHDFNNLLQGIFGYISMAKLSFSQKEKALKMLEEAEKALHMSVNLTSQLLTFSKGGKPLKKMISLQPVIENSAKFALSGSRVDYRIMLDEELWTVEADEGQIGQVIQNLVLNADQAMPLGGTIKITAKNVLAPKEELPQHLGEGKYVVISVKDSGIGISEQYLQKIFDPYYTTKEKGSGLGLATSYSIVRTHGGVIKVNSKVDKGTTFYVYLPALEGGKETSQVPASFTVGHKGKILLMDEAELIRNIAGELLKTLEHEVEFADRGEEAIGKYQRAREADKPFDIVILDLTIRGGMGGKETIKRLLAIDPGIKAIVSSGYSDDAVVAAYEKYGFKARLTKPYKLENLRDTLNALLSI